MGKPTVPLLVREELLLDPPRRTEFDRAGWGWRTVVAILLGGLAIAVDVSPRLHGGALVAVSTGLSWAGAAVVLGALSSRLGRAAAAGATVLAGAVVAYYCGIWLLGTRPQASPADLTRSGVVWSIAAATAGPIAGLLGWLARRGSTTQRPLAWGALGGLLLSQGLFLAGRWVLSGRADEFPDVFLPLLLVPPLVVLAGSWRYRPVLATATMGAVGAVGALAWAGIMAQV